MISGHEHVPKGPPHMHPTCGRGRLYAHLQLQRPQRVCSVSLAGRVQSASEAAWPKVRRFKRVQETPLY